MPAAVAAAMATAEAAGSAADCGMRHSHRSSGCKMNAPGPNLETRSSPAQAPYLCTAHHSSTPCRCPVHMGSSSSSMTPHRQAQAGHRPRSHPVWTTLQDSHTRCPTHHHAGSRRVQHLVTDRQPGGCHLLPMACVAEVLERLETVVDQVTERPMAQLTRSTPCCTQAGVAACSYTWSLHQHRMSTRTPEWPCSSSSRMMSGSGSTQSQLIQDRHGMDALYAASQAGLCRSAVDQACCPGDGCPLSH